jgi:hypothetical protein
MVTADSSERILLARYRRWTTIVGCRSVGGKRRTVPGSLLYLVLCWDGFGFSPTVNRRITEKLVQSSFKVLRIR